MTFDMVKFKTLIFEPQMFLKGPLRLEGFIPVMLVFFGLSTWTSTLIPGSAFVGITLQFSFVTSLKIEFQEKYRFEIFLPILKFRIWIYLLLTCQYLPSFWSYIENRFWFRNNKSCWRHRLYNLLRHTKEGFQTDAHYMALSTNQILNPRASANHRGIVRGG